LSPPSPKEPIVFFGYLLQQRLAGLILLDVRC
jgi:hypothetical protein